MVQALQGLHQWRWIGSRKVKVRRAMERKANPEVGSRLVANGAVSPMTTKERARKASPKAKARKEGKVATTLVKAKAFADFVINLGTGAMSVPIRDKCIRLQPMRLQLLLGPAMQVEMAAGKLQHPRHQRCRLCQAVHQQWCAK